MAATEKNCRRWYHRRICHRLRRQMRRYRRTAAAQVVAMSPTRLQSIAQLTLPQRQIIREVATLVVFAPFAVYFIFKG